MLIAFGASAQQTSNYVLPYRTQTRMLQVLQVNPNVTRDSVLVRTENGWLGSTPFPSWSNLSGKPTFSAVAISGSYNDLVGRPTSFPSSIPNIPGLQTAIDGKISIGANIPYGTLTGVPSTFPSAIGLIPGLRTELDGKQPVGNYLTSFTELDPTISSFVKSLTSTAALRTITDPLYRPISYVPSSAEIVTSLGYLPYNGNTNPNGYITSAQLPAAPVTRVNNKTGDLTITATDVGLGNVNNTSDANKPVSTAMQAALDTKITGGSNITFTKVRTYQVTSNATTSVWTLNTGTDFTNIFDVQVQAVSVGNTISGIRNATINSWTASSNSFSGVTHGSQLVGGAILVLSEGLRLIPSTSVRITVYGN